MKSVNSTSGFYSQPASEKVETWLSTPLRPALVGMRRRLPAAIARAFIRSYQVQPGGLKGSNACRQRRIRTALNLRRCIAVV
jgi:hypothetical protein